MERKGKASTIVFSILLVVVIVLCVLNFAIVTGINTDAGAPSEGTEGSVMAGAIMSFVVAVGFLLVIALSVHMIVISAIGLKFCIRNIKSDSKTIRVINIILT